MKRLTRSWAAAGALSLTAALVCGAAMAQAPGAVPDGRAAPLLRQGTIVEEDLTGAALEPALPAGEAKPETPPAAVMPEWPAVTQTPARPEAQPGLPRPYRGEAEADPPRAGAAALTPQPEEAATRAPRTGAAALTPQPDGARAGTTALAPQPAPDVPRAGDPSRRSTLPRRLAPQPAPDAPVAEAGVRSDSGAGDSYALPDMAKLAGAGLPQREASMKVLQQGKVLLRAQRYQAALARFEQAIRVDSSNPYSHYFVARAHHSLGNHRESMNFLEVAESALAVDDRWLAEVYVLRARNAGARGFHARADHYYVRALAVQPSHGYALARLTTIEPLARAEGNP